VALYADLVALALGLVIAADVGQAELGDGRVDRRQVELGLGLVYRLETGGRVDLGPGQIVLASGTAVAQPEAPGSALAAVLGAGHAAPAPGRDRLALNVEGSASSS
jgi:hypothetical protein